jgi:hypothetical protein
MQSQSEAIGRKKRPFRLYFYAMAKLKVGQKAPNMQLQTLEGDSVALANFWENGRSALLIFLRHLA